VAGPDLPRPREPFTAPHLDRWPPGAELRDGQLYWPGEFDERDVMVARRAFPGSRVRIVPGAGLMIGPVREQALVSREWTDQDGTGWHQVDGLTVYRRPGEAHWTMRPLTRDERRSGAEQVAADRAQDWTSTAAGYAADPDSMVAAWRYLTAHPIFWSYRVPDGLAGIELSAVDEDVWARIETEGWLCYDQGLADLETSVIGLPDGPQVRLEHGPMLWPLDVPAEHRMGMRIGGTPSHDPRLDVSAPSWEQAIVALAAKVRQHYGDDRAKART
jgi:hypothetical protein